MTTIAINVTHRNELLVVPGSTGIVGTLGSETADRAIEGLLDRHRHIIHGGEHDAR